MSLPRELYRAEQVRTLDREAIQACGIPGLTLMERAGTCAFGLLRERWPGARRIAVVCGPGNNGGDGYVAARLAREAGIEVTVLTVGDVTRRRGDAEAAAQAAIAQGLRLRPFEPTGLSEAEVAVDAMLGTGLERDVEGPFRRAIESLTLAGIPVLAIDIPSGLHADTGRALGTAVNADVTITFIGLKQGLYTGDGPDHTGDIVFDDLGVPAHIYQRVAPTASRLELSALQRLLPPRRRTAHKGHFGHVLVIGGDVGYGGAARMAGEAALRVGAGLVSLATRAAHAPEITAARPELMCHPVEQPGELQALLERSSVLAVGPGLGRSPWACSLLARVLDSGLPRVLDADALNGLADEPQRGADWVLTPHPGEAARLLGCPTPEIQADRYGAVVEIQRRYGGVAVLKGAGTLVCDGSGPTAVCAQGNPGMASGGMGDVLTGVIGGLLAQGLAPYEAACLGVCVHAAAGDRAAPGGERGLIATDLLPVLRSLVNFST